MAADVAPAYLFRRLPSQDFFDDKHFIAAQLQAQQRFGSKSYVRLKVAGALQAEKTKEIFDNRVLLGVQGSYYYSTMFGPVGASLGYSNHTKEVYFYLNLGYEF